MKPCLTIQSLYSLRSTLSYSMRFGSRAVLIFVFVLPLKMSEIGFMSAELSRYSPEPLPAASSFRSASEHANDMTEISSMAGHVVPGFRFRPVTLAAVWFVSSGVCCSSSMEPPNYRMWEKKRTRSIQSIAIPSASSQKEDYPTWRHFGSPMKCAKAA